MNVPALALFMLAHASMVLISIPLANRRVKPNRLYGFRTPKTLSSERVWYDANANFGRLMLRAMVWSAVLQVIAAFVMRGDSYQLGGTLLLIVPMLIVVFMSFFHLSNL